MLCSKALAWGVCVFLAACRAAPQSGAGTEPAIWAAAASETKSLTTSSGRRLQGRFLHITDFHPDPFYKTYSSTEADAACHRKRGPAGIYGAETSACDSPLSLVDETFKWVQEHLRDEIDFIIWTGDSARHDNDEKIPRTQSQVIKQNQHIVSKFSEVFGRPKDDHQDPTSAFVVPIIPTFGNNDIMPHNIFLKGPNKWTMKYLDIWRDFIPEEQRHSFQLGGWFSHEVIPNHLVIISMNTLYFFDSNSGVDGCANKHEPGYEHMEWLRVQLRLIRERGMKAMLIGHVPPARVDSKESWDETCWQKLTLWERQYRDVIVGSFYGHMNIDHFMLHDFKDLKKSAKKGRMSANGAENTSKSVHVDGEVTVESASDYLMDLGDAWSKLPTPPNSFETNGRPLIEYLDADEDEEQLSMWGRITSSFKKPKKGKKDKGDKEKFLDSIGGKFASRFSVAHVSPSVVPNYFPTLRVFSYNISGLEDAVVATADTPSNARTPWQPEAQTPILDEGSFLDDEAWAQEVEEIIAMKKNKKEKESSKKKKKKYKFKVPEPPSKSSPPGPAYSPQTLSLVGYVQYFANLTHINHDFVTQSESLDLIGEEHNDEDLGPRKWKEGKHHKHQGKRPHPKPHPRKFKYEVEYNTTSDHRFKLSDLTVRSYVDLAMRIGQAKIGKNSIDFDDDTDDNDAFEDLDLEGEEEEEPDNNRELQDGKKKKHKPGHAWYTFVRRAFVDTMDPREIEEMFGMSPPEDIDQPKENMEL